jgi:hypothetical protein
VLLLGTSYAAVGEEDGKFQRVMATTKGRLVALPVPNAEPMCEGRAVSVNMYSTIQGTCNYTCVDYCCNPVHASEFCIDHADPANVAGTMNALNLAGLLPVRVGC